MQKRDAAAFLAGVSQVEGSQASAPTNLHVISGEVGTRSDDGKTTVAIDGLVFSEADDQYVEMDTLGGLEEGDIATVILTGEDGHAMTPLAIGAPGSVDTIRDTAEAADSKSDAAQELAQAAKDVADAVGQHFWSDDDGAHVTQVTQDEWNDSTGSSYHSGPNSLWNSLGMLFRDGLTNLLAVLTNGVAIYDGNGNDASNIVATFGANETHIGQNGEGAVYLANDTFALTATSAASEEDPDCTINDSMMKVTDSNATYQHSGRVEVQTGKHDTAQGYNYAQLDVIAEIREDYGAYTLPVTEARITEWAYADGTSAIDIEAERVTISGHGAYVQTASTSSNVSVASGSDRSLVTITVTEPGCYILIGHVNFATNTSGRRVMGITTSQNASLSGAASTPVISQLPVSGGSTLMTVVDVVTVGYDSTLKRYLTVYQNSGSAISCNASIKAVRVAAPV